MNTSQRETVIVGGGQAGLALSYYLKQGGREHVVLERAPAVANAFAPVKAPTRPKML